MPFQYPQIAGFFVALLLATSVDAVCVLPVPDGGNLQPSEANIYGHIASVLKDTIVVVEKKTGNQVEIVLPKNAEIYSAFGDDVSQAELAVGQTVWVWLHGCRWPTTGRPTSAYLQVYSGDPQDRP